MWSSFLEYGYWKLARAESGRPQPLREERERERENVPEHDVGCFKKNAWELYGVLGQPSLWSHILPLRYSIAGILIFTAYSYR